MKLTEFNFELPETRIARFPSKKRDESKLMLVNRKTGEISHHKFKEIVDLIDTRDFLVVNNSKVIPVRLFGQIDGKKVEMLIVKTLENNEAEVLTLPAKRFKTGEKVYIENGEGLWAEVMETGYRGRRKLKFNASLEPVLNAGYAPLPPYIKRKYDEAVKYRNLDLERYQTVYSKKPGSIAAPTAGLHFTSDVVEQIKSKTEMIEITLEVGEATFQKIEAEDISNHIMGKEWITIPNETRQQILDLKKTKNLIAVGTTSVRSMESWASLNPTVERFESQLFISPGYEFKMVDRLVTNFHLPESSLFILVCSFAGIELMHKAYRIAIEKEYNFFSYGDAMFII